MGPQLLLEFEMQNDPEASHGLPWGVSASGPEPSGLPEDMELLQACGLPGPTVLFIFL